MTPIEPDRLRRSPGARPRGLLVAAVVWCAVLTGTAPVPLRGAQPAACPVPSEELRSVTAILARWAEHRRATLQIPGLALGVVCGDAPIWTEGFGMADPGRGIPATPSSPFRIASITKLFTATAVLALRDAGALELDDAVVEHLPDFAPGTAWPGTPVTVRHLLTHTSGLPTNSTGSDFNRMVHPTGERMMELLVDQELLFEPGTDYGYSNLGYAVLGRLAASVYRRPFDAVVRELVLEPLALERTVVHPEPGDRGARGHGILQPDGTRRTADFIELDGFTPAGGMASTVGELASFLAFHLDPDGRADVLRPATVREMQTLQWEVAEDQGIGLGWGVDRRQGRHEVYHGGELPTQTSHVRIDLTRGFAVAALTNARDGAPERYVEEALGLLRLAASGELAGGDPHRYVGTFRWKDWEMWTVVLAGGLHLIDPTAASPAASARALTPIGDGRFRMGGSRGEIVRIVLDPDGDPLRLELPGFHLPAAGVPPAVPAGLEPLDRAARTILEMTGAPGASLAVARDERLVLARGYGVADAVSGAPVEPGSLFRIASVSKPITAVAVLKLVEEGRLSLSDRMVDVLGLRPPVGVRVDPRMREITVRDLLGHAAGWDRTAGFDPMFAADRLALAMGEPPPATASTIVRAMLGRPLDFDPGSRQAYSNLGYAVLGRIVEEVTGERYGDHVRRAVLEPAGIGGMRLGRSLLEHRAPGEVRYHDSREVMAVFPGLGFVPAPYGAFSIEAMDAHGGWLASAEDLLRFLTAVDGSPDRPDVLSAGSVGSMTSLHPTAEPDTVHYGLGWYVDPTRDPPVRYHMGDLPGTTALVVTMGPTHLALLLNGNAGSRENAERLLPILLDAVAEVERWPDGDLFGR